MENMKSKSKRVAEVWEDNAGGLTLYVCQGLGGGRADYAHAHYEESPGQLATDLEILARTDCDTGLWGGCEDDIADAYVVETCDDQSRLVCEVVDGQIHLHQSEWGAAAKYELSRLVV